MKLSQSLLNFIGTSQNYLNFGKIAKIASFTSYFKQCLAINRATPPNWYLSSIPDKKRNAPLRTGQFSGKSQVIGQFSLYQCKGMSVTVASYVFCNQASKLC